MAISNPTPKQVRNGTDQGASGSGATVAKPGPDATREITSMKRQAEAAADRRKEQTAGLMQSSQGSGPPPGGGMPSRVIGNPGGSIWEWDAGLAINDVEGGGSG